MFIRGSENEFILVISVKSSKQERMKLQVCPWFKLLNDKLKSYLRNGFKDQPSVCHLTQKHSTDFTSRPVQQSLSLHFLSLNTFNIRT